MSFHFALIGCWEYDVALFKDDKASRQQECIPVGCVLSTAVAISPGGRGVLPQCILGYQSPQTRHTPRPGTPPDQAHPSGSRPPGADTSHTRHPPMWTVHPEIPTPLDQAHIPPGTDTPHPGTRYPHPHCGQTDTCKNITFATSLRTVTNPQQSEGSGYS